jgi:hypothetical protein
MLGGRQHLPHRGWVTRQLVGDHHPWRGPSRREHTPQERFGSLLIAPLLDQDVQHHAMLVSSSPQPVTLALDLQ